MKYISLTALPSLGLRPGEELPAGTDIKAIERWLKAKKIAEVADAPKAAQPAAVGSDLPKRRGKDSQ